MTTLAKAHKTSGSPRFKQGMRTLVSGVCVIGAHGQNGSPVGLTATAVTSLAADPPALLVCINRQSSIAPSLTLNAAFSVNVLSSDQVEVAKAFGGQLEVRGTGRFFYGNWHRSPEGEVPLLTGCRVAFECRVVETHDWATHQMVIGLVSDIHFYRPDAAPLTYCDGRYGTVAPLPEL